MQKQPSSLKKKKNATNPNQSLGKILRQRYLFHLSITKTGKVSRLAECTLETTTEHLYQHSPCLCPCKMLLMGPHLLYHGSRVIPQSFSSQLSQKLLAISWNWHMLRNLLGLPWWLRW